MNAPSHPLPHSRQPFSRDWQELMDTIPAPSHPELCVLCWCPQHPSRTELRVPTLVICFTRHSLLAASTYSLFFPSPPPLLLLLMFPWSTFKQTCICLKVCFWENQTKTTSTVSYNQNFPLPKWLLALHSQRSFLTGVISYPLKTNQPEQLSDLNT